MVMVAVAGALHLSGGDQHVSSGEGVTRGERPPWGVGSIIRVSFWRLDSGHVHIL